MESSELDVLHARIAQLEGAICWAVRNLQRIRDSAGGPFQDVTLGCLDYVEEALFHAVPRAAEETDRVL